MSTLNLGPETEVLGPDLRGVRSQVIRMGIRGLRRERTTVPNIRRLTLSRNTRTEVGDETDI